MDEMRKQVVTIPLLDERTEAITKDFRADHGVLSQQLHSVERSLSKMEGRLRREVHQCSQSIVRTMATMLNQQHGGGAGSTPIKFIPPPSFGGGDGDGGDDDGSERG